VTPGDYELYAKELKADGYTGGVVARKLISQYGMEETAAVALVSQLYGKPVNPRGGESVGPLLLGLGLVLAGVGGIGAELALGFINIWLTFLLLSVAGSGVAQLVKALVNVGAQTKL
jgi:hypothetical protein